MLKKIQERIFPFLIAISALSVSASAAFYSVSGLSKLFAGAALAVIIMAASLEVAKLVIASLLYQYRKTLPLGLKIYLTTAAFVLVLITSMGIYGFLSAAYQETANKAGNIDAQISLIETKRDNIREQLAVYNAEKSTINGAISDLRSGLSNNTIQYKDKETGQIITTTSSSTRRALEKQLDQAVKRQTKINTKIDTLNTQLFNYETEIVEVKTGNDLAGELGPLKYLSGLTGTPMDKIINYLLLTIIFVFDPLAIALVIAANFAFEKLSPKTKMKKKLTEIENEIDNLIETGEFWDPIKDEDKWEGVNKEEWNGQLDELEQLAKKQSVKPDPPKFEEKKIKDLEEVKKYQKDKRYKVYGEKSTPKPKPPTPSTDWKIIIDEDDTFLEPNDKSLQNKYRKSLNDEDDDLTIRY